ncbi:RNA polymerase II transcription factor SIII subunit A3-like-2, partial [Sigmodon hispidus]
VEMKTSRNLATLRKLRESLCRETEPSKLYKTLKELSSLPMLCDTLEEIGFRQTIKLLKKQKLLVPFARDFAARWSEGSQFETQPMTKLPRQRLKGELHESMCPEQREDAGQRPLSSMSEAGP